MSKFLPGYNTGILDGSKERNKKKTQEISIISQMKKDHMVLSLWSIEKSIERIYTRKSENA